MPYDVWSTVVRIVRVKEKAKLCAMYLNSFCNSTILHSIHHYCKLFFFFFGAKYLAAFVYKIRDTRLLCNYFHLLLNFISCCFIFCSQWRFYPLQPFHSFTFHSPIYFLHWDYLQHSTINLITSWKYFADLHQGGVLHRYTCLL